MDPDKCLEEIRAAIKSYRERSHGLEDSDRLAALVAHVEALDEWLASGGFKPEPWKGRPRDGYPEGRLSRDSILRRHFPT